MVKKYEAFPLFLSSFLLLNLFGAAKAEGASQESAVICGKGPSHNRITVRHIEANGVGYNQGYSTLEGFFAVPKPWNNAWLPFLDVRGHIFNNGKPAVNAGLGVRYLDSRIWGVNAFYDYRNTKHQHYNQVSIGFESLGEIWDFRLNGYLPIGDKNSSFIGDAKFDKFEGHYALLSRKYEFAMKGVNAEVGGHVNSFKNVPLYFAAGPYWLEGKGKVAWGGEARAVLDIFDYVRLEGNTSYDNVFKWIGQGQLSVIIPFGGKRQVKERKKHSCAHELALAARAVQRVDRNEIIPVDKKHKKEKAINPSTGQPYFFWFVDNTSSSAGTFESPFPTLQMAQTASSPNDIIYTYSGDGTTKGMDQGFVMKDKQKIWGAGIDHVLLATAGMITVPAQSEAFPLVSNINLNSPGITLANSCEVAGLHITGTNGGDAILGGEASVNSTVLGITDTLIQNNIIANCNVTDGGIALSNCQGDLIIKNNIVSVSTSLSGFGIIIENINVPVNASVFITNNQVAGNPDFSAIAVEHGSPSGHLSVIIKDNTTGGGYQGIFFGNEQSSNAATMCGTISGNNSFNNTQYGLSIFIESATAAQVQAEVLGNQFHQNPIAGMIAITEAGNICVRLANNNSHDNVVAGYLFEASGGGVTHVENLATLNDTNIGTFFSFGATSVPEGSCSCK